MQQEHAYSTADVPTKGYVASLTTIHCHLIEVAALCGERGTSRKGGQTNLLPRREMGRAIGNVSPVESFLSDRYSPLVMTGEEAAKPIPIAPARMSCASRPLPVSQRIEVRSFNLV